ALTDAQATRRPSEDRSSRCREAGEVLPQRRFDRGLRPGRDNGGDEGPRACPRVQSFLRLTRSEDAKRAQGTARRHSQQFLLRHGHRYKGKTAWTGEYMEWVRYLVFEHEAHNRVLVDYVAAVESVTVRLAALTKDIHDLVETWSLRPLVKALQALRGVQLL